MMPWHRYERKGILDLPSIVCLIYLVFLEYAASPYPNAILRL